MTTDPTPTSEFRISAFLICKNEMAVIEKALQSLTWADEVIVVDAYSDDDTADIARRYTPNVYYREWTGFKDQRNFALSKCQYPWVFFLDADEVCSRELILWFMRFKKVGLVGMASTVSKSTSVHPNGVPESVRVDLYEIRRLEHFRGHLYSYGANNPSHQWRFFRREGVSFVGEVHEYPVVKGLIVRLETPIYHYPKTNLADVVCKMNRYSTLEAEQLFEKRVVHYAPYMLFSGLAMFLKSYFRKQGFRDRTLGLILASMDAGAFFLRQAKLYLKNRAAGRI